MLYFQDYPTESSNTDTLIVMHGLFGSSQNWRQICKQLSESFHVYALDLRNHGQSPHIDGMSYTEMADDLIEFMDAQDIQQAHLLGHSMGGKTAMQAALAYPDRFLSLINADIAPVKYPPRHQDVFAAIDKINNEKPTSRKAADELVKDILPETGVRLFLLTNLNRADENGVNWKINMPVIKANYEDISAVPQAITEGKNYAGPTLIIKGSLSPYIKPEDTALFEHHFPNAEFATIEKAGHWLHAEQPKVFLELVNAFLK